MKSVIQITLLLFICSTSAFARLGENYSECTKRYGPEMQSIQSDDPNKCYFSKNGTWIIICEFDKNRKCVCITYSLQDKSVQITNQIAATLLANNSDHWEIVKGAKNPNSFVSSEGYVATVYPRYLMIAARHYIDNYKMPPPQKVTAESLIDGF